MFPRFYFIGDEDLLEILGQATNPAVIQTHLKKLFAGIHNVNFDEGCKHIIAMKSLDGEVVPLMNAVTITDEVEVHAAYKNLHNFAQTNCEGELHERKMSLHLRCSISQVCLLTLLLLFTCNFKFSGLVG